jgi:hypothetical protein
MKILFCFHIIFLHQAYTPRTGDLLFQDIDRGPLCDAIEQVTTGINGARFSHVGLVIEKPEGIFVIEAVSEGVVLTPVNDFLIRSTDSLKHPKVIAGRLKPVYRHLIPDAVAHAEKYIGKPYDMVFNIDNDSFYCSELVYLSFKAANDNKELFTLAPMTFKSPGETCYFPVWQEYFNKLGVEVPEGMPGINPGDISRSGIIDIVHVYGKPDGYIFEGESPGSGLRQGSPVFKLHTSVFGLPTSN